ncbi:hypothetical protein [Lacticaseibacillus nasuensis]|uniref:hypothetical protein n=1 Tax=Lacticaseibacillus nasuensis TaxID=944671 RepID=UPI002245771D|nr:hypothetical protein [Lacticaseibacillus nasuensis]MCX2455317.1 hypothetical protein [Lacticaseibacillus nasuensis]
MPKSPHQHRLMRIILIGIALIGVFFGSLLITKQLLDPGESSPTRQTRVDQPKPDRHHRTALATAGQTYYFTGGGVNSPTTIAVVMKDRTHAEIQLNWPHDPTGKHVSATVKTIPAKQIRLYSTGTGKVRSVSVRTQLTVSQQVQVGASQDMYLYRTAQGKVALVTPNYAGNSPDPKIMAEYLTAPSELKYVQSYLAGTGFSLTPIKYNGEDIDQAMNENKAPQNSVSDNFSTGNFTADGTAQVRLPMMGQKRVTMTYRLTKSTLSLAQAGKRWKQVTMHLQAGKPTFPTWTETDATGATITWQFQLTAPEVE